MVETKKGSGEAVISSTHCVRTLVVVVAVSFMIVVLINEDCLMSLISGGICLLSSIAAALVKANNISIIYNKKK